jgi:hypothetical protein
VPAGRASRSLETLTGMPGRQFVLGPAGVISAVSGQVSSDELESLQAGVAVFADNEVIVHRDAKRCRHRDDLLRHFDVSARRRRVAGGMVVQEML